MRKPIESLILVWVAVAGLAGPVCAEEPSASPNPHASGGMGGMGPGMMGGGGMMSEEQMDQRIKMMQDHMLQMHEIMDKIQAATDPAEKEKLKQQQRDMIKQHMKSHHQMMLQMQHQGGMSHGGSAGAAAKP
jgi:hypothetical protein